MTLFLVCLCNKIYIYFVEIDHDESCTVHILIPLARTVIFLDAEHISAAY